MGLTNLQKGALGLAGLLGFLGLLSIKTRAEEPVPECVEGNIEYLVCVNSATGETTTVIQSPRMMPPENSIAMRECREGGWVDLHPEIPLNWCLVSPTCEEDVVEVLEYCPDGVTPKRWRECVTGNWIEHIEDCPIVEACVCNDWVNMECTDTITGIRKQRRTCNPSGCDIEEQNVSDPSCIEAVDLCASVVCPEDTCDENYNIIGSKCNPNVGECEEYVKVFNSGYCQLLHRVCSPYQKCVGYSLYKMVRNPDTLECELGPLVEENSGLCGYTPPTISAECKTIILALPMRAWYAGEGEYAPYRFTVGPFPDYPGEMCQEFSKTGLLQLVTGGWLKYQEVVQTSSYDPDKVVSCAIELINATWPEEKVCVDGEEKCETYLGEPCLWRCENNVWYMVDRYNPKCWLPPTCNEGDIAFIYSMGYRCVNGKWVRDYDLVPGE